MNIISKIDRFDASWTQIEKREGQSLKQLKAVATVRSVGASTRIEGSKMSDDEVEALFDKLKMSKLQERDEQEVAGYYEALNTIAENHQNIEISEGNIKNLHKILMQYSEKDAWHSGNYKQLSNAVEATQGDGTKQLVFKTTEPGFATEDSMRVLIEWYANDKETLPIVKTALFVYDFLSIHPFQDGNGRLSRLITTLLLLKQGYSWIEYISFEHEIESRKGEYYKVLMQTQRNRPGEKVDEWVSFFLDCLINIQDLLMEKLKTSNRSNSLGPKERTILSFIENHPGSQSGEISNKLNIPLPTVKKILSKLVDNKIIAKYGAGAGTNYEVTESKTEKNDMIFKLTNSNKSKEFILQNPGHFIEFTKIILLPLFQWTVPDEWATALHKQGLEFIIEGRTAKGSSFSTTHSLIAYNNPYLYQPVFNLYPPINLPLNSRDTQPKFNEYPLQLKIDLISSTEQIDFELMFVYNEIG